jgi:hypothetical protein
MSRVIAFVACGLLLAACSASLPSLSFLKSSPQTATLRIESDPPGAEAKTTQGPTCRTPCEVEVMGDKEFSVTVALEGYQAQTVLVVPEGAAGGPQDAEIPAGPPRVAPNPVYVELAAAVAAPPAKKPVKKRKKPATAKAAPPAAAPTTTASVPAAPPAPAASAAPPMMPAEPAASATNYPWPSR